MQFVLVFNSGSSSFKFSLFPTDSDAPLLNGVAEALSTPEANMKIVPAEGEVQRFHIDADHQGAIAILVEKLPEFGVNFTDVVVVGHRVVHGGEAFSESVVVDDFSLGKMESCSDLAPLHNPAAVLGIRLIGELYPNLPQVAVFDTAFHQTLEKKAYLYAVPYHLYEQQGVRRYGFHGTSHRYVAGEAIRRLGLSESDNQLLIAHLGNGCSATAVSNGKSVDTTMGLTPLEGLVMGTRSGDVDPSLHQFLQDRLGWSLQKITDVLNRESGLLGISRISNDMRTLVEAAENGNESAQLAIDVFCFRLARQLAGLAASLSRIDAVVFTGGIGENNGGLRKKVLESLAIFGFTVDGSANAIHGKESAGVITTDTSPTRAMVIQTNEEAMIARDAKKLVLEVTNHA
ncbi:acetate/propionate family kinase [Teredinibacter turnerae]|uniref:acetate/propionate family kinase n=1 Tax=Teredinibacter turnerae TaxID=2426 RepID=UPI000415414A|nr:acetate kinase [Teredinibacter turnerae]